MTAAARLMALFVAPQGAAADAEPEADAATSGRPELRVVHGEGGSTGAPGAAGPLVAGPTSFGSGSSEPGPAAVRVCVLGTGRAARGFTHALATRLARDGGGTCVVVRAADGIEDLAPLPRRPLPPGATARHVARTLLESGQPAVAEGRLVLVAEGLSGAGPGPAVPLLVFVEGARADDHDSILRRSAVIVVVVPTDAPEALASVALAELGHLAPAAAILAVPLPPRPGTAARRAAVARVMGALR